MEATLSRIDAFLWGPPLIIAVLGVGLYFTIRSGFFQFGYFGYIMKNTFGRMFKKADNNQAGILSSFQAVCMALAGAIGVGNIAGAASAIAVGGPGAVFWMWIAALVGMMNKMVEITLAVHYRDVNPDGSTYGGPTYYMEKGLGKERGFKLWILPALLFGVGIFSTYFLTMQCYSVSEAIQSGLKFPMIYAGIIYSILVYVIIFGGIPRIGSFAEMVVPFMAAFYIVSGIFIVLLNITNLPTTFGLIFKGAFTPMAAAGGFGGAALAETIRMGMARSVYSNEAGWGTAPMAHATAKVDHPVRQGLWGVFEVFVDTIIVCSITAIVIIITGEWSSGVSGATLTLNAFRHGIGDAGVALVSLSIFLFGVTTSIGWYSYFETLMRHLLRKASSSTLKIVLFFLKIFYPIPGFLMVVLGATSGLPPATLWSFADIATAIPTFVNIIVILILSNKFFELLHDFKEKEFNRGSAYKG